MFIIKKLFCFSSSGHVCYNNQLTSITPNTRITAITGNLDYPNLSDVGFVEIEDASVTFIPDFTVVTKQFPKFKQLWIERSGLKYVERRQLAKMPQLTWLSLAYNLIEHLPEDVFNDLVNLEELHVGDNKIKLLPPKLLWNLPKLKILWASFNHIELIPRDFFKNNRELEQVWISNNKITRIEVDFTLLPKLTSLNLNNNTCINEECYWSCNIEKLREIQQKINRNCTSIA
jgi:Leucine-rich repeat (LRR) protein